MWPFSNRKKRQIEEWEAQNKAQAETPFAKKICEEAQEMRDRTVARAFASTFGCDPDSIGRGAYVNGLRWAHGAATIDGLTLDYMARGDYWLLRRTCIRCGGIAHSDPIRCKTDFQHRIERPCPSICWKCSNDRDVW